MEAKQLGIRLEPRLASAVPNASSGRLVELGQPSFESGYWQGLRQAAVLVPLWLTRLEVTAGAVRQFDEIVAVACPNQAAGAWDPMNTVVFQHPVLGRLLRTTLAFLERMGMPVMSGATAIKPDSQNPRRWIVGLPAISEGIHAPQAAFALACWLMNELAAGRPAQVDALASQVEELSRRFRPLAPAGINTLRFLRAAHDIGIPWRHVANNVYQLGWGARSRWLDSSFTDETSTISASLARDKVACAKVLRDVGLPVPKHQLVRTAEQAVKVAQALGYPVVLKPANLDGGAGVMAGLRDAQAVTQAFAAAGKLSKRILVEQFIEGSDYRIRTCNGVVNGVVVRKPAAVIGDGIQSVQALLESTNRERAGLNSTLDPDYEQGNKRIVVDDEVRQWLRAQGLDLDSVVPSGQRVRLRGAANVSLGGTLLEVSKGAHPDNLDLALRAAAALRLDVAGVDLLLPDIKQSWKETGGVVCEVNGQPQFSHSAAIEDVLQLLVTQQGRIPVVFLYGLSSGNDLKEFVIAELLAEGLRAAWHEEAADCIKDLIDKTVNAIVWAPQPSLTKHSALPVDRPDLVIEIHGQEAALVRSKNGSLERWSCSANVEGFDILKIALFDWLSTSLHSEELASSR